MRNAFEIFRRFVAERRGHAAIITALAAPVLVGSAGLGVEAGYWFYKQRVAQMSADIAAYSGAVAARSGGDSLNAVVQEEAARHGFDASIGALTINNPPTGGPNQHNRAVEVRIDQTYPRLFSALFLDSDVTISVRAVALFQEPGEACILALEQFESDAMIFTGNSNASLTDCQLMSNSIASDALSVQGSGTVTTTCATAVGGVDATANLTLTDCSEPRENAPPAPDPYESLPAPSIPGGCTNVPGGPPHQPKTVTPGHYCGGLDLRGDITMEPGVYVVSGDVTANGNSNIVGDGVTIYVRNNGRVRMNGTATVDLTAPSSGTYAGVLFFGDRNNGSAVDAIFNGTADSSLEGVLYFPNQEVMMRGDFNGSAGCTRVISRWVDVSGNTSFDSNCANASIPTVDVPGLVQLVE
ncbi:hypothetical protein DDZ18_01850 [Marinicauda salina]|jgi:hypothetical protein|uniref:DUF7305 domain-containing protein n=1 Tax=Marinicauda salina TaxID=2135793 RepID=A0A2U2BWH5_9PROT|nr:pilus assembly protein TadG-related protein [Marinicauda salina]PWE18373.1 hypothetical protein DDZ18_01850 [Marinicauda salina]